MVQPTETRKPAGWTLLAGFLFAGALALAGCLVPTEFPPPEPGDTPSAPLNVRVTTDIGNDTVRVYWDTPLSEGSGPITRYFCSTIDTLNFSELEVKSASSPCVLVVPFDRPLNVFVYAENKWSTKYGYKSPPSEPVSFKARRYAPTVPSAPRFQTVTVTSNQVNLGWYMSDSDGGIPITGYTVLASPGGDSCVWTSGPRWCSMTGLSPDIKYTFTVRAQNSVGASLPDSTAAMMIGWTQQNSGTTQTLRAVTWTGSQLVAVGDAGTILTSPNGLTWTPRVSGVTTRLNAVKWIADRLIAVGDSGTLLTSPDGISWTLRNSGTLATLVDVDGSPDTVVVVQGSAATLVSVNDSVWQAGSVPYGYGVRGILWTGTRFIAVGNMGYVYYSSDGLAWTRKGTSGGSLNRIVQENGRYVVVGYRSVMTSTDGDSWKVGWNTTPGDMRTVVWNGLRFIAIGQGYNVAGGVPGGYAGASDDGESWYPIPSPQASGGSVWTGTRVVVVGSQGRVFTYP